MRIFIYKEYLYRVPTLCLYVAKNDDKPVEKVINNCTIGEDWRMTMYNTEKILSLFPGKTIDDFKVGMSEITDPDQELLKALGRRKVFSEFVEAISKTVSAFPMSVINEIGDLEISYSGGDLSGKIKWIDGEEDSII